MPDICLFRVEADHPLIPLVYDPCVVFVAQGEKEAWLENKQFRYNASNYLLLTVPLPLRCRVINTEPNKPFLAVRLNLNLSVIRELLHDEVCMLEESDQSVIGMETSAITEPLNTRLVKLLDTMDKPSHIASQANRHYREIMRLLLQGPQARMLRNFAITDRQCNRIALAINYIHQHFSKSLCIEQLADVAAMSPSSFHEHFKNGARTASASACERATSRTPG